MIDLAFARATSAVLVVSLLAIPLPVRADQTIRCDSYNFGYRYCRVDTDDRVELVNQLSLVRCKQDRSWGYDRRGVWVDHGCSAEFRVGRDRDHKDKALAIGAAVAGIAIIAALSAHKNSKQQETDVEGWAVGSFSAYDETERSQVQLTILPGGSVSGRAGNTEFSGNFTPTRLEAGRYTFRVERASNGFVAIDERNDRHRLVFQRSGGGY